MKHISNTLQHELLKPAADYRKSIFLTVSFFCNHKQCISTQYLRKAHTHTHTLTHTVPLTHTNIGHKAPPMSTTPSSTMQLGYTGRKKQCVGVCVCVCIITEGKGKQEMTTAPFHVCVCVCVGCGAR